MNLPEVAQTLGIILGSGVASYLTAKTVVRNRADTGAVTTSSLPPPSPSQPPQEELAKLGARLDALGAEMLSVAQLAHSAQAAANSSVTVEEFEAYALMDSERRERIIGAIGEVRGQLDLVLKRM